MNKQEYMDQLRKMIDEENEKLKTYPDSDIVNRGLTIGRVNGLLLALNFASLLKD